MIQVHEQLEPSLLGEISAYLSREPSPRGVTGEHDVRWLTVLRDALRHKPVLLVSRQGEDGPVDGYLPLALVKSALFGRFLVSLPYLNQAGVVADDAGVEAALIGKAVELADLHDVKYLELRQGRASEHDALGYTNDQKVRMILPLPDSAEQLWKDVSAKVRNLVRKGEKESLSIRWGGRDVLDDFYDVFAVNMRDLGTPVYSRSLFGSIVDTFGDQAELATVHWQGQAVAGAMLIHDTPLSSRDATRRRGQTHVPSASSLRQFNHTNANMWMYHQLLLRAIERGSEAFDFGRSSVDSGTYRFKKQWGAAASPTAWQYHLRKGDASAMRPDNPSNRRKVEIWQKLPVWLTRLAGPSIVRGIP